MASYKIAIDMDSSFTNIYLIGGGLVLSEPTVAAASTTNINLIKAVGYEAKKLIGKTVEDTKIIFPVFEGDIVNEKVASLMLSEFLKKIGIYGKFSNVSAVFSVFCGIPSSSLEKFENVAKNVGISKVSFVETPLLSIVGQRVVLSGETPKLVVDMGGSTSNIAVVTSEGVITGMSINCGYNNVTTDIIDYVADKHDLQIGLLTAERIRNEIGSLFFGDTLSTIINGRDIKSGTPRSIILKSTELFDTIKKYYDRIGDIAKSVLIKLMPEASAEIRNDGLFVSGIGSQMYYLENYYRDMFKIKINIPQNPDKVACLGAGMLIDNPNFLKKIRIKVQ